MSELGATEFEISQALDINRVTLWRWKQEYPEFCNAIKIGSEPANNRVEASLYQRAIGYSHEAEKIFINDGEIVRAEYIQHYPPDTAAAFIWLKNRCPDRWRNTQPDNDGDADGSRKIVLVNDPDSD